MRCRTCDYRLWNLRSRQCPECGAPFTPSEFEFVPGSVQFCCPHCNQAYYGTDDKGRLVPDSFDCGSCGQAVHMDDMVLLPTEGLEEEQTQTGEMPWLHRKKRGGARAWLSMVGLSTVSPYRLMRMTPVPSSVGAAFWFAIFTNLIVSIVSLVPLLAVAVLLGTSGGIAQAAGALATFGVFALVFAVANIVMLVLWGLVTHGLLRATGATTGSLGRTYHAICYSAGANVLTAIPCLGFYIGWIWWVVSAVLMTKEAQGVRGWRAALAVLTLPALLLMGFVGSYGVFVWFALSGAFPGGAFPSAVNETVQATEAVMDWADDAGGAWPEHAIQLTINEYLEPPGFASWETETLWQSIPITGATLAQFDAATQERRSALVQATIAALPDGTVAHRLGDFVFTYHGIDPDRADGDLWLVVYVPDPDQNAQPQPSGVRGIGMLDGSVVEASEELFQRLLPLQNTLRAKFGLPPLPDPATVTHANPAVASP